MSNGRRSVLAAALIGLCFVSFRLTQSRTSETIFEPPVRRIETANPCVWRNSEQDLTNWFFGAVRVEVRDLILSSRRLPLQTRLGRPVRPEEMALRYHLVSDGSAPL